MMCMAILLYSYPIECMTNIQIGLLLMLVYQMCVLTRTSGLFPVSIICFGEVYLLLSSLHKVGFTQLSCFIHHIIQVNGGLVAKLGTTTI